MTKLSWREEFSVGYSGIDEQHKEIIELYNEIDEKLGNDKMVSAEEKLGKYIGVHFRYELDLMESTKYPNLILHNLDHRRLLEMYGIIKKQNANKSPVMKIIVYRWFVEHVINDEMDRHLGKHLSLHFK